MKPGPRAGHVAVSAGNHVLIWGGYDEPFNNEKYLPPNEVWLYDPSCESWFVRLTSGDVPPGLSGACAVVVLKDHAMFIIGGHGEDGNVNTVYRLDLRTWQWQLFDSLLHSQNFSPRDKFVAWEHRRKLYIFGGYGPSVVPYLHDTDDFCWDTSALFPLRGWNNQMLEFDLKTSTWSLVHATGSVPSPRAAHGAAKIDDKLYVFGGRHGPQRLNDLYMFSHTDHSWTEITIDGELPDGRSWHSFTPISADHVLLFGGYTNSGEPLGDAWLLDLQQVQWRRLTYADSTPRLWHTGTPTDDGNVIVFGGCHGDILSQDHPAVHTDTVRSFRITPVSLLRLSLNAAFIHRGVLQSQFSILPRHLCDDLQCRISLLSPNAAV